MTFFLSQNSGILLATATTLCAGVGLWFWVRKREEKYRVERTADRQALERALSEIHETNKNLQNTQVQLFHLQKIESLGKLTSGIAHDFNNILGCIVGYASLLKDELEHSPRAAAKLNTIYRSAERGADLTRQILGFVRKGSAEKKSFNLNDTVEEVVSLLYRSTKKTVDISTDLEENPWPVRGNTTQILQAILNLGVNARDAVEEKGEIILSTRNLLVDTSNAGLYPSLKPGAYMHVSVADTGPGIPAEVCHKILEPFFTTKADGKGSGLGLSVAADIIRNHRGQISFDSEEKKGATFHLFIPVLNAQPCGPSEKQQEISPLFSAMNLENKTVLIADDEPDVRDLRQDMLEGTNATVLFARDGIEAVTLMSHHAKNVDLVILDMVMPNKDGVAAFREIRKIRAGVPIVIATGYGDDERIQKLRRERAVSFIEKPFDKSALFGKIQELIHPN